MNLDRYNKFKHTQFIWFLIFNKESIKKFNFVIL